MYTHPDGVRNTPKSVVKPDYLTDDYNVLPVDDGTMDWTPHVIANFESVYLGLVTGLEEPEVNEKCRVFRQFSRALAV